MYINHIKELQEKLKLKGLDGILLASGASMYYVLGKPKTWWQRDGGEDADTAPKGSKTDTLLYVPVEGNFVLLCTPQRQSYLEDFPIQPLVTYQIGFHYFLRKYVTGKNIAYGAMCATFLKELLYGINPSFNLMCAENLIEEMRYFKTDEEIDIMRKGANFVDFVLEETIPILKQGITYHQVEEHLISLGLKYKADDISFHPTVRFEKTGTNFGLYYTAHSDDTYYKCNTPLEEGSSISFDFGYVKDGYCSDFGRSFYLGKAPTEIKLAYAALQESVCVLHDSIKPYQTNAKDMYNIIRDHVDKRGYKEHLLNHKGIGMLAHQIGIDVHENPWIHNEMDFVLKPGMIMCIEPKILIPNKCFLRVEDMVLIKKDGAESLTKFDRNLFELI